MSGIVASTSRRRIVLAMSGGVDSSVAAYLLKNQQQHDSTIISGLFMDNWSRLDENGGGADSASSSSSYCVESERDGNDAQAVCDMLDMRLHRTNFSAEYWTEVFEPFVAGVGSSGRGGEICTPNPDISCNAKIKFGVMRDFARERLRATHVATGHYARLWNRDGSSSSSISSSTNDTVPLCVQEGFQSEHDQHYHHHRDGSNSASWLEGWGNDHHHHDGNPLLVAAADQSKDQSYFLCGVSSHALRQVLFPLGDLTKKETRAIAAQANLPTSTKRESMGICFIGRRRSLSHFLSDYLEDTDAADDDSKSGVVNFICIESGDIVGSHSSKKNGTSTQSLLLTVGQGAKIPGASQKWFVCGKGKNSNKNNNHHYHVCQGTHHPALYSDEIYVNLQDFRWMGMDLPPPLKIEGGIMRAFCRIRHLQPLMPCMVTWDREKKRLVIRLDEPLRGITHGQTAALYVANGIVCLGGGPMAGCGPTYYELQKSLPQLLHPSGHNDLSVAS